LQEGDVINVLAVGHENAVQGRENPSFPIDQGAIAVESQDPEAIEVEHGCRRGLCRWAAFFGLLLGWALSLPPASLRAGCRAHRKWHLRQSPLPQLERPRQLKGDSGLGR